MLYDILVVSGFWFWIEMLALLAILFWSGAGRDEGEALPAVIIALVLVAFSLFSSASPLSWVYHNPVNFILILIFYCLAGAIWAVFKWFVFVTRAARDYADKREEYTKDYKKYKDDGGGAVYKSWLNARVDYPTASKNKSRITAWIAYWPFSILWSLVSDYLFEVFNILYNALIGTFDGITKRIFRRFDEFN